jgi:radical SAM protein with 4Fe4S-binding SPASM domain
VSAPPLDVHPTVVAVQQAAFERIVPLNVTLELTLDCNIRCLHCYNFDRDRPHRPAPDACAGERSHPLSLEEVLKLLGDLREAGCLFLGLTGGEVLSYPHLFAVLDRARDLHLAVQLLSNGTLLRPGTVARLASYRNILGLSVSIYGSSAAVHDGITQVPGSFRRTWHGIERVRAAGLAVRLKFVVMRQNAHEVAAMRAHAEALGYPHQIDLTITSRHDGTNGSLGTRVEDEQVVQLLRGPLRDLIASQPRPATTEVRPCNCARGNCAVLANGDVTPCISVPWRAGNVRERSFADIWRDSPVFQQIRGLRTADYRACTPCPDKSYCSRPRGAAFTASRDYTGIDPFVCRVAHIRRDIVEGAQATPDPRHPA